MTTDGDYDYYVWNLPVNGIQNGAPDGVALSQNGTLVEFLSYEGSFAATNGSAAGTTSTDIGVAETGSGNRWPVAAACRRRSDALGRPASADAGRRQ